MSESHRLRDAGEWVLRLSEGRVPDREIAEWMRWCDADHGNLDAFEKLQSLWNAAREQRPAAEVITQLMREDEPRSSRLWLPIAACAAAIGIGLIVLLQFMPRADGLLRVGEVAQVRTPVARNEETLLPDGSRVDVAARSVLDVSFTSTQRHLSLRDGQAFFTVRHDKNRPFIVEAGGIRIKAIGTAFDVRRAATRTVVTVQQGVIEITAGESVLQAVAGKQMIFDGQLHPVSQTTVDPAVPLSWRSGRLEFTGEPLSTVVASANRYSVHPIVLADAELENLTFTGTLFTRSIEASLDALEQVFPIEVERAGDTILLRARR